MPASVGNNYLEAEILTATPQRLHLLLIEGAIRNVERTRVAWQEKNWDTGCETLIRSQQIVSEILSGLNPEVDGDLTKRVASLYLWIYRTLVEAGPTRDESKLAEVIRVLEIERATWRELCEKLGNEQPGEDDVRLAHSESTPPSIAPADSDAAVTEEYAGGFSLDA